MQIEKIKNQSSYSRKLVDIRFLSPTIVIFVIMCVFLLTLTILPVKVNFPLSLEAFSFWIFCVISFFVGTFIGAGNRFYMPLYVQPFNEKWVNRFLLWIVIIGFFGTVLLLVDRFIIRGVSLVADVLEKREMLSDSKSSALSSIAAMASSFGVISYLMVWVAEIGQVTVSRGIKLLAIFSVSMAIFANLQMGSRSLMLVVLIIYFLVWFFSFRMRGGKVKLTHVILVGIVVLMMTIINAWIMIWRTELMEMSMLDSIFISAYAEAIEPSPFMRDVIENGGALAVFFSGMFSLVQYLFHGIYEFSYLFENFKGSHELGTQIFWLPIKVASMLTGGAIPNPEFYNFSVRTGIFNTFAGPIFIDFGLFSPVALFLGGAILGLPYRWFRMGKLEWLPTVVLVVASTILWPVVNIFTSASGAYLLVVTILIGLFGRKFRTI